MTPNLPKIDYSKAIPLVPSDKAPSTVDLVDVVIGVLGSNVPNETTSAFICSAEKACRESGLTWSVIMNTEDNIVDGEFSRSAGKNKVIRAAAKLGRVLVQTDIDIRFSGEVLKKGYDCAMGGRVAWFPCRNVGPDGIAVKKYRTGGMGSFNAATIYNWYLTGGFEELMTGWGSEDTNMHIRFKHRGIPIVTFKDASVLHMYHPPRGSRSRVRKNRSLLRSIETNYLGE